MLHVEHEWNMFLSFYFTTSFKQTKQRVDMNKDNIYYKATGS